MFKKSYKKLLTLGLAVTLTLSTLPLSVFAVETVAPVTTSHEDINSTETVTIGDEVTTKGVKKFVTKVFIKGISKILRSGATKQLEAVVLEHFGESYITSILMYATPIADKLDDLYNWVEMPLQNFESQLGTALQQCGASPAVATKVAWCITKIFDWGLM